MPDANRGIYRKFEVRRVDGSDQPGGKHEGCPYFVLDLRHDKFARAAIRAYADACEAEYPELASDLRLAGLRMKLESARDAIAAEGGIAANSSPKDGHRCDPECSRCKARRKQEGRAEAMRRTLSAIDPITHPYVCRSCGEKLYACRCIIPTGGEL